MDDFMPDGPTTVNVIEYLEFVVCFCTDGTPPDQLVAKLSVGIDSGVDRDPKTG